MFTSNCSLLLEDRIIMIMTSSKGKDVSCTSHGIYLFRHLIVAVSSGGIFNAQSGQRSWPLLKIVTLTRESCQQMNSLQFLLKIILIEACSSIIISGIILQCVYILVIHHFCVRGILTEKFIVFKSESTDASEGKSIGSFAYFVIVIHAFNMHSEGLCVTCIKIIQFNKYAVQVKYNLSLIYWQCRKLFPIWIQCEVLPTLDAK